MYGDSRPIGRQYAHRRGGREVALCHGVPVFAGKGGLEGEFHLMAASRH